MKQILVFSLFVFACSNATAQFINKTWHVPLDTFTSINDAVEDPSGNIILAGYHYNGANRDFLLSKITASGDTSWIKAYDSGFGSDEIFAVTTDHTGAIYVAGETMTDSEGLASTVQKYSSSGVLVWEEQFNGDWSGNSHDYLYDILIDNDVIFASGATWQSGGKLEGLVLSFDPAGNPLDTATYEPADTRTHFQYLSAMNGNIYVAGESESANSGDEYLLAKYNSTLDLLWDETYNSDANINDDVPFNLIAENDTIYITGSSELDYDFDAATLAYATDGTVYWTDRYTGANQYEEEQVGTGIKVSNGGVYIVGYGDDTSSSFFNENILFVRKLSYNGSPQWTTIFNNESGTNNTDDIGYDVAILEDGNLLVAGKADVEGLLLYINSSTGSILDTLIDADIRSSSSKPKLIYTGNDQAYLIGDDDIVKYEIKTTVTGVLQQAPEVSLSLYPVPARDRVFIDSKETIRRIRIFQSDGRLVTEETGSSIFVGGLEKGMYLLSIDTESGMVINRTIIKH